MSAQAGYYEGGYTGDGNRREVAGVTHKGENRCEENTEQYHTQEGK